MPYTSWHGGQHETNKEVCHAFHCGMFDDTKQIRKSCNLCHLYCCDIVNDGEFFIIFSVKLMFLHG